MNAVKGSKVMKNDISNSLKKESSLRKQKSSAHECVSLLESDTKNSVYHLAIQLFQLDQKKHLTHQRKKDA